VVHVQADVQQAAGALDHGEHLADLAAEEPEIGAYAGIDRDAKQGGGAAEDHIEPVRQPVLTKPELPEDRPVQGLGRQDGRKPERRPDRGHHKPGGAADKGRKGDPCLEFPVSHQRDHRIGRGSHSHPS
jgi:hypothetical protein